MKVKEIRNQLGNDLFGTMYCEYCGNEQKLVGYNDAFWFMKVLPSYNCNKCGKNSLGETIGQSL